MIAQAYPSPDDRRARMLALATYLLVEGPRTYFDLYGSPSATWYPEYGIDLGPPRTPLPRSERELEEDGLYIRRFVRGVVVVNPGGVVGRYAPGAPLVRVVPVGGGAVPGDARLPTGWRLVESPGARARPAPA